MNIKAFTLGAFIVSIASWGVLYLIINWVDPTTTAAAAFILFFLTLFLAVAATSALIGYMARSIFMRHQLPAYRVRPSLRQGLFLGVFVDLLLFLQLERILVWWVSAIIVLLFIVIELVFISYDKQRTPRGTAEAS